MLTISKEQTAGETQQASSISVGKWTDDTWRRTLLHTDGVEVREQVERGREKGGARTGK